MDFLQDRIIFQHVARHGGFGAAARALPYGIGEAAIRKRIRALEQEMGLALCHRQPFRLTPEGRKLYEHDRPHFEALAQGAFRVRSPGDPRLRAGVTGSAAKLFLLPAIQTWLRERPRGTIETRTGPLSQLLPRLKSGELDLLLTALDGDPPEGFASHVLATFSLVLLTPLDSPLQSVDELWRRKTIEEPLISPETEDPVTLAFERGLRRGGITWSTRLTHDSPAEVVNLVARGLGLGLALAAVPCGDPTADGGGQTANDGGLRAEDRSPTTDFNSAPSGVQPPNNQQPTTNNSAARGIRELRLPGFDAVPIVALWRPEDSQRLQDALHLLRSAPGAPLSDAGC